MSTWSIEETHNHIKRLFGRTQLELARPSLRSVVDRQDYARYHYHEAKHLLDTFTVKHLAESKLIKVAFSEDDDIRSEFDLFMIKVGANVLACIQSMHAVGDILAHATYYALGMNQAAGALKESAITSTSVLKKLSSSVELEPVHRLLKNLVAGGDFSHLAALANQGKHRSIIRPSLSEDWTGLRAERHQLKLEAFTYKAHSYPDTSAREFLESEFNRSASLVVEIGNAINDVLQQRTP